MAHLQLTMVFLLVISMFCMESVASDGDVKKWTKCGESVILDKKKLEITADMSDVKVGQACLLGLSRLRTDYTTTIEVTAVNQEDEECGMESNRVYIISQSYIPSANAPSYDLELVCGKRRSTGKNTPLFSTRTIALAFYKASTSSKLLKFEIKVTSPSPSDKVEALPTGSFKSSTDKEWQLYSPLFPVRYKAMYKEDSSYKMDIETDKGTVVFFNFQSMVSLIGFKTNTISIEGLKTHTIDNMKTVPLVVRPKTNSNSLSVVHGKDIGTAFEIRFRSLNENKVTCTSDMTKTIKVEDSFYLPVGVKQYPSAKATCNVKLTHGSSNKAFKITQTSSKLLQLQPKTYQVEISVGDRKKLPLDGNGVFGFVQGMKEESVTITVVTNTDGASHSTNPDVEIGFVVELVDMENPPNMFAAQWNPSYIWIPRDKMWQDNGLYVKQIRTNYCQKFSALNSDSSPRTGSLSDVVSLYTTTDTSEAFDMTKDCFGAAGPSDVSLTPRHLTTFVVPKTQAKSQTGFWLKMSSVNDVCNPIVTAVSVASGHSTKNLFDRLSLKKYMNCTFVLPKNEYGLRFRWKNVPRLMRVTEGSTSSENRPLASFDFKDSENWYYSKHALTIRMFVEHPELTTSSHPVFEYGARKTVAKVPGCPGPKTIEVDKSKPVVINTPAYPGHLESNTNCQWTIKRPASLKSKYYLHVEIGNTLKVSMNDTTKVYMTGDEGTEERQLYGDISLARVFSKKTDSVTVRIEGGQEMVVDGIKMTFSLIELDLSYMANCGKTFTVGKQGDGDFPGVSVNMNPGQFVVPFVCKMHFKTENPNDKVALGLHSLMIKANNKKTPRECGGNSLQIIDDENDKNLFEIGNTCVTLDYNKATSKLFPAMGNQITVVVTVVENYANNYIYDFYGTKYGDCRSREIQLEATPFNTTLGSEHCSNMFERYVKGCDDDFIQCDWLITSQDADIQIRNRGKFNRGCDSVEIYDGPNMDVSLGNLCGMSKTKPTIFKNRALFLRYKSTKKSYQAEKSFILQFRQDVAVPGSEIGGLGGRSGNPGNNSGTAALLSFQLVVVSVTASLFLLF